MSAMPEFYMRNLQRTSAKMLRAQERMMHGLMHAAQLQMKFSQDFWANRGAGVRTDVRQEAGNAAVAETERMLSVLREITETMQRGFTEAMQLLMENNEIMAEDARETGTQAAQDATYAAKAGVSAAHDNMQAGINAAHDTINKTGEAMQQGANELKDQTDTNVRNAESGYNN
jgi:hypothetical protein